jgi:cytoskeletal protein RodZ
MTDTAILQPATLTLGEHIKNNRLELGLDLDFISKKIWISKKYLEAIEEDRISDIPFAPIYKKNFVLKYAEAVGIPTETITEELSIEIQEEKTPQNSEFGTDYQPRMPSYNMPAIIKGSIIAGIVILLLGYLVSQVNAMVAPPELDLFSPGNGLVTSEANLPITGRTNSEAKVFINGQEITTDSTGHFSERVILSTGINSITVTSETKHGKETKVVRHITLTE